MRFTRCYLTFSFLLLVSLTFDRVLAAPQSRMVGSETTHISNLPAIVSVRIRQCDTCTYEHYCGGTIYSSTAIITASNCVRGVSDLMRVQVVAGTSYRSAAARDGRVFLVDRITVHEDNNIDLAIIHLKIPLELNNFTIKTVKLASELPRVGKKALVAGWGQQDEKVGPNSEMLREIELPIIDLAECRRLYFWTEVKDTELCAGYPKGVFDACQGDAGSPLLLNNEMIGLVSWGYGCARPNNPGVYTNVVNQRNWIASHA